MPTLESPTGAAEAARAPAPTSLGASGARDRAIIVGLLVAITAVAWAYVVRMEHETRALGETGHPVRVVMSCCGVDPVLTFVMWVVMMVGMMLPSAGPMVLTFAEVHRQRGERGHRFAATSLFVAGYLLVWTAFSAVAAFGQWALFEARLLDPHRQAVAPFAGGLLLVGAGLFQLTSVKRACLGRCRAPRAFLEDRWRGGHVGALVLGLRHGAVCAGCCWGLMVLLFVVGVMNLVWVAILSAFVLAEKVLPWNRAVVWSGALACLASGAALIALAQT